MTGGRSRATAGSCQLSHVRALELDSIALKLDFIALELDYLALELDSIVLELDSIALELDSMNEDLERLLAPVSCRTELWSWTLQGYLAHEKPLPTP